MAPKRRTNNLDTSATTPSAIPPNLTTSEHTTTTSSSQPIRSGNPSTQPPSSSSTSSSHPASSSTSTSTSTAHSNTAPSAPTKSAVSVNKNIRNARDVQEIVEGVWRNYVEETPQRVKLVDCFMGFLVVVGVVQFVYCVVAGNYPFNAFLAGFSATVGQFVLTASLRIQTNPQNKGDFETISDERAFADYVFGSLLLHFFCVNFIN